MKLVLGRLQQVLSCDFPNNMEAFLFILEEDEIDIKKLENGLDLTDTCATIQRFCCLFKEDKRVGVLVYKGYCWNHMRDIWIKAVQKRVTCHLSEKIKESTADITSIFHVLVDFKAIIVSLHKKRNMEPSFTNGSVRITLVNYCFIWKD